MSLGNEKLYPVTDHPIDVQGLLDALPFFVMLVDDKHRILAVNSAIVTHYGCKQEQLIGRHCPEIVHGTSKSPSGCPLEEAIMTGTSVEKELFDEKIQGWFSSAICPTKYRTPDGSRIYVHIVSDITRRRLAEEAQRTAYEKLQRTVEGVIRALTKTVEFKDPYTAGHQQRVSELACAIAEEMGFSEECVQGIRMAGLVHDLGKIAVPADILSKPGQIGPDEFNIIKKHSQIGYEILKDIEFSWPIAQIVLQHQERLNGSGYPQGLSGDEIMPEARILAVADVVEAMSSHRPYRQALGIDIALKEISKNKAILYDPEVVDATLTLFHSKKFKWTNKH